MATRFQIEFDALTGEWVVFDMKHEEKVVDRSVDIQALAAWFEDQLPPRKY